MVYIEVRPHTRMTKKGQVAVRRHRRVYNLFNKQGEKYPGLEIIAKNKIDALRKGTEMFSDVGRAEFSRTTNIVEIKPLELIPELKSHTISKELLEFKGTLDDVTTSDFQGIASAKAQELLEGKKLSVKKEQMKFLKYF